MAKIENVEIPSLLFTEGSAPSTPASGFGRLYVKTTGLFFLGDNGVEVGPLAAASGASALAEAKYVRTSGNYTTTSTTFVDVDATNLALAVTTGARRVMVGVVGTLSNSGTNTNMLDIDVDGTRAGGDFGLMQVRTPVNGYRANISFTWLSNTLTAASHTFKLKWLCNAGTATLYGTTSGDGVLTMWVKEVY